MANHASECEGCAHERELRLLWQGEHERRHEQEKVELDRRLEDMNELRDQINRERVNYLARDLYDREHSSLGGRVTKLEASSGSVKTSVWMLVGIIGSVVAMIAVAFDIYLGLRR